MSLWTGTAGQTVEYPAHNELRTLRTEVFDVISNDDIDRILTYLHPDVVVTWQNGEACRGHNAVRDFFERMGKYASSGYKKPPTPAELTILHGGDTGGTYGKAIGQRELFGKAYTFENHWTATRVKQDRKWLLASYHVTWNVLDCPQLTGCKRAVYDVAPLAFLIGMIFGGYVIKCKAGGKQTNAES